MYLSEYRRGRMGLIPAMVDREFIAPYSGSINRAAAAGYSTPTIPTSNMIRYIPPTTIKPVAPIIPVVEKPTPITAPMPGPMPVFNPQPRPPVFFPTPLPIVPPTPAPAPPVSNPNAGTPVPAGFPTNQLFVNSDGSFWQWSGSAWVNVGTPYNTGAAVTPPAAAPPSSSGAPTVPAPTNAPVVNVTAAAPSSQPGTYQEILDFLSQDTLLAAIGFSGIPNWLTGLGGALLLYKVAAPAAGRR